MTVVVLATVALTLTFDLGRRALDTHRIQQQVDGLAAEVEAMEAENQALLERLEYVKSEAYVEEAAREVLGWTRRGDTAVVILTVPSASESGAATSTAEGAQGAAPWRLWWELLFGP